MAGAKALLSLATRYGNERTQFGKHLTDFGLTRAKLAEMACQIFAGESLCYRTAGMMDAKYEALVAEGKDPGNEALQASVEEYAIEASIMKVFGSEVLDMVADEAQQIHGGYGYMVGYDVERAVRDARINRIFEGTNEINRLLLVGTLLKRAMRQQVPLLSAVAELETALGAGTAPPYDDPVAWLDGLDLQVQRMRHATLFVIAHAVRRYGMAIEEEQATLAAIADMMIDVFAADSAVRRTLQHGQGEANSAFFLDASAVFTAQALDRAFGHARHVLLCGPRGRAARAGAGPARIAGTEPSIAGTEPTVRSLRCAGAHRRACRAAGRVAARSRTGTVAVARLPSPTFLPENKEILMVSSSVRRCLAKALPYLLVLPALGLMAACASTGGSGAAPVAAPAAPPPPAAVGNWTLTIETPQGTRQPTLAIMGTQDNLEGTFGGQTGEVPLSDLNFSDGKLTFTVTVDAAGQELQLDFAGTVEGDTISGALNSPFGEIPATGVRNE